MKKKGRMKMFICDKCNKSEFKMYFRCTWSSCSQKPWTRNHTQNDKFVEDRCPKCHGSKTTVWEKAECLNCGQVYERK